MTSWSDRRKQVLSPAAPYWSEGIGLLFGLGTVLVAFPLSETLGKGHWVLLTLVSLAAGAGAVSAMRPDLESLPRTLATNQGARIGCRTGLLTAVLGGAVIVAVNRARGDWLGVKWLAAVMSILPGAVAGMIGGAWSARLRAAPDPETNVSASPPPTQTWGGLILASHLMLSALGYLSPLFLPSFLRPRPVVISQRTSSPPAPPPSPVSAPAPSTPTPSAIPAPPPFIYEIPEGLVSAPAWRWEITRTESISPIDVSHPVAVSADGKLLAHVASQGGASTLKIIELKSRGAVTDFILSDSILRLDFSPDSKRLVAVVNDTSHPLRIFDLDSRETIELPKPRGGGIPDGPLRWWTAKEVGFFFQQVGPVALDLDTLRIGKPNESAFWKSQSSEVQKQWSDDDTFTAVHRHWPFGFVLVPSSYQEPSPGQADAWPVQARGIFLTVRDATHPFQRVLSSVTVASGDRFVHPPDSGVLLRLREQNTDIFYFGLRPAPKLGFKISMPWTLVEAPNKAGLEESIAARKLWAFVCGPLINPLNHKAVAPDRGTIKALARISMWKDREAQFWIAEEYAPIAAGDVIGDLHVWEDGKMKPAGPSIDQEWWAPLPETAFADGNPDPVSAPTRAKPPTLRRVGAMLVVGNEGANSSLSEQSMPTPLAAGERVPEAAEDEELNNGSLRQSIDEGIRQFVLTHHQKAARGDVAGVVADYADMVDHFSNGVVGRDFIFRDEQAYHAKLSSQTESVEGRIEVTRLSDGLYEATYPLAVRWSKPNGESGGGTFEVSLRLRSRGSSFGITRHRSVKQL